MACGSLKGKRVRATAFIACAWLFAPSTVRADVGEIVRLLGRLVEGLRVGCARELLEVSVGLPVLRRVSVASDGSEGFDAPFLPPVAFTSSFSGDGRRIAFDSDLKGLVPNDTNDGDFGTGRDVFVRDLDARTTERASVNAAGEEADRDSEAPNFARDGGHIAFVSGADNFVGVETAFANVFVKDLASGAVDLVGVTTAGEVADFECGRPSISAEGRYVAFETPAVNLRTLPPNVGNPWQIYLRDRAALTTEMLTVSFDGTRSGFGSSSKPRITADGRFVVFESQAPNLIETDANGFFSDVFLWDREASEPDNRITLLSVGEDGMQRDIGASSAPWISPDGRYATFTSTARGLVAGDDDNCADVFVRDRMLDALTLVSKKLGPGVGSCDSGFTASPISEDGRYVAFESNAANLVDDDANGLNDVFVRDLVRGATARLNTDLSGLASVPGASAPSMSRDGCLVAFSSLDADLVVGDDNIAIDYFLAVNPLFELP